VLPSDVAPSEDEELDLRAYLGVVRRRWKAIALVVLLVVGAAVAYSASQRPLYRASSEILIAQRSTETLFTGEVRLPQEAERQLNNEVRILESGDVRRAVSEVYEGPLDPDDVGAAVGSDTSDVIEVSTTAGSAEDAAELVNQYVEVFIELRRAERVDELLQAGSEIQTQIDDIDSRIADIRAPLDAVEDQLAQNPGDAGLQTERDELVEQLANQLTPLESQRAFYQQQLEDLELTAGIAQAGGARVLTVAEAESEPVSPKPIRDAAIAVVLGLVLGVGLAFLLDNLDERIRGSSDLARISGGMPTIGLIPEVEGRATADAAYVALRDDARSAAAEAYRSLRTSVKFSAIEHPLKVIQVTSPTSGEGKTTTIANLAVALAQGGDRVAVVCCDLRRPRVHERFRMPLAPGFTDVLLGDAELSRALRRDSDRLFVLPAGSPPPNPSELLSTGRASAVVSALRSEFDVVLLDTTPVLPVTDALVVSRLADATLVVADGRSTKRSALERCLALLRQVNAPVIGLVLNGVTPDQGYSYGYGSAYQSRYVDEQPKRRRRRRDHEPEPASA
jgi:polysaccharide biosynthesis transport protein